MVKENVVKMAYMIQRKSDGLFSNGGQYPSFKKNGKVWSTMGGLKNHLHQFHDYNGELPHYRTFPYKDCRIVALKSVITELVDEECSDPQVLFESLCQEKQQKVTKLRQRIAKDRESRL